MTAEATGRPPDRHKSSERPSVDGRPVDSRHMARNFSIRNTRLSISLDVPDSIVAPLRKLKHTIRPEKEKSVNPSAGHLQLATRIPKLYLQNRDPEEYMPFFRSFHDAPSTHAPFAESGDLGRRIAAISWYHTIELPDGNVTPGIYDHRPLVPHYGIPADLQGKRVLDVATFDGFWAFEFERRGAEVTALDIGRISECDFPPVMREAFLREGLDRDTGEAFRLAHEALQSRVRRVECSVYDLSPDRLGMFEFVHVGDLLLHLENPIAALRSIRSVTAEQALISDCVDSSLGSGLTRYHGGWSGVIWWLPSLTTLAQMIIDTGFASVSVKAFYRLGNADSRSSVWRAAMLATP